MADSRTTGQLMVDALVQMVSIAGAADSGTVFGTHRPGVRVTVTLADLDRRRGAALVEGQTATVSVATAERRACTDGYLPILFGEKHVLDLGSHPAFFSGAQRIVLAVKWGGCVFPACERPPSWTEAHHIDEWQRYRGRTDVTTGCCSAPTTIGFCTTADGGSGVGAGTTSWIRRRVMRSRGGCSCGRGSSRGPSARSRRPLSARTGRRRRRGPRPDGRASWRRGRARVPGA